MNNSIRTDSYASILRSNFDKSQQGISKTLARMSSGLKVLSAKDDASGAVISAKTKVELNGINIANNNIQMATSMFNVAEDALSNAEKILIRLRDLSLMAADSSYDRETRKAIQDEADALSLELEKIQENTVFNKVNLFDNQKDKINKSNNNSNLSNNSNGNDNEQIDNDSGGGGIDNDSGGILNSVSPLSVNLNTPLNLNLNTPINTSSTNSEGNGLMRSFGVIGENSTETDGIIDDNIDAPNIKSGMKLMGAGIGLRGAVDTGIVADNEVNDGTYITGAFDFAKNEEYKINIDGVIYDITNRNATDATISYSKEISTGKVTFTCNYFTITGISEVQYNTIINGTNNWVYGGNLDDTFTDFNTYSQSNKYYGKDGNDTITTIGYGDYVYGDAGNDTIINRSYGYFYGGAGDDTFNSYNNGNIYGEGGEDTFNLISGGANTVRGGDDNDIFNVTKGNNTLYGEGGEDTFNIISGSNNYVDGGNGTNAISNSGINTTLVNVPGATSYSIDFAKNEEKILIIDGKSYTVKNKTNAQNFVYSVDNGLITFNSDNFIITGQQNVAHNVMLKGAGQYFYGGDLSDTIVNAVDKNNFIYAGGGDDDITFRYTGICYAGEGNDTITLNGGYGITYGEGGNDTININANISCAVVDGGDGDDIINANKKSISSVVLAGGNGTNTINSLGTQKGVAIQGFDGYEMESIEFGSKETKDIVINGIIYNVKNTNSDVKNLYYKIDNVTNKITFAGSYFTITGQDGVSHNVDIYGKSITFNGGDCNDTITIVGGYGSNGYGKGGDDTLEIREGSNGSCVIHGDDGNDNLTLSNGISSNCSVYGENGNDIFHIDAALNTGKVDGGIGDDSYYINKTTSSIDNYGNNVYYIDINGITLSAGAGNDTFYITGNDNNIAGGGGDDYFIVSGTGNTIDGGTGTNYIVDNGEGNIKPNTDVDPNSGGMSFTYVGEQHSFSIADKMYMVKNSTETADSLSSNNVSYTYNQNTGEIIFTGNNLTITACDGMSHNIRVEGNNNTINGGDCPDTIIVNSGTNNLVKGNAGNDNITLNSADNAVQGGSGNDNVSVNATTNKEIDLGDGNDTIYLNSNNNTSVNTGSGNDTVRSSSQTSGNTITLNNGNNDLLLTGNNNTISSGSGNNRISVIGNGNEVSSGSGSNIIGARGDSNTLRAEGNTTFNVQGSDNSINLTGNNNIVNSTGNNADITSIGNNTITSRGANSSVDSIGKSTINVVGDNSSVTSIGNSNITTKGKDITLNSIGKSTINQTGDSATIETQTGNVTLNGSNATLNATGANLNITGNSNEISNIIDEENYDPKNEIKVEINIEGNENNLTTNNTSDDVQLTGNSNTLNLDGLDDTVEIIGNNNNAIFSDGKNSIRLRGDSNNIQGGLGADSLKVNSGKNNVFEGGETTQKNTIYDLGEDTIHNNCVDVTPRPLYLDVQVGYDAGESIRAKLQFLLGDFWVDVSDVESANESVRRIDEVLEEVHTQLSSIGSQLNRFESIFELNNNTRVNLESKNSLIVDCDIAKESVNYAMDSIRRDISASIYTQIEGIRRENLMNLVYGATR